MLQKPLISIIIPVYNCEKYIRECLDSVLAQTYTHWEAILVDDGSPDRAGAICDEYAAKDKRFRVIHQENRGVVSTRNRAIATATGDFLAFVDSDDTIEPTMLEEMLTLAEKENLDIVHCNIKIIFTEKEVKVNVAKAENGAQAIGMLLSNKLDGWLANKLIRKKFWDKCNITTDEKGVIMEDAYISIQLYAHNPQINNIESYLYNYNHISTSAATGADVIIKAQRNIDNIYRWLKEKGLWERYKEDFAQLAMTLKIGLLKKDIEKAISCYPYAHKRFSNFNFTFLVSAFYWFCFNSGCLGKLLFKIYFKTKR